MLNPSSAEDRYDKRLHYQCIAQAISYLYRNRSRQPSLTELSEYLGFSPAHLQRLFVQWAGISPKRYQQVLTTQHARQMLAQQQATLDVTYSLGLSSPSRLHDLLISCEALSPAQIRSQGQGLQIHYGYVITPFGDALLAWTGRGLCYLAFLAADEQQTQHAWLGLQQYLPQASLIADSQQAQTLADRVFHQVAATGLNPPVNLHLLLKGTNFQVKVWEALLRLGDRPLVSYQQLATSIGQPTASRAVASAVAANQIAWLIPCHRVIRQQGDFGEYRWGAERKCSMLAWELANLEYQTRHIA